MLHAKPGVAFAARIVAAAALSVTAVGAAHGGTLTQLYSFPTANNGGAPLLNAQPVLTKKGQLFGTAGYGFTGANMFGDVFSLTPPKKTSTTWKHTVLYGFKGGVPNSTDGYGPFDGLTEAAPGVFYGFTAFSGPVAQVGCGLIYQLKAPPKGQTAWAYTVLYRFQGSDVGDGCNPENEAPLISADGSIYGTTMNGGGPPYDVGTLFQLHPPTGGGTAWTESVLWRFRGGILADGSNPMGSLVADSDGDLFGTTSAGGNSSLGTVWEYATTTGTFLKLHDFLGGADGAEPMAGLTGPLPGPLLSKAYYYGTTAYGGGAAGCDSGCGTLFAVAMGGGSAFEGTVHAFAGGTDGAYPHTNLFFNASGLWGTTTEGGTGECSDGCGTIFNLGFTRFGWNYGVSYSFELGTSGDPETGLTGDSIGHLYGMTKEGGGSRAGGTVFEYSP